MSANFGYALDPGLIGLLTAVGVRHQDVLRRAGLPEDLLDRTDVRVHAEQFFAVAQAIQRSVDDPLFPIHLIDAMSAEWFSPPLFAALCSPDLTVAVTRLARFKSLVAPIRLDVEDRADGLRISMHWLESTIGPSAFLIGCEALFIVKVARMGTRHHVHASSVTLPEPPRRLDAFEEYVGCPIKLGDTLSVTFRPEDARRPFLTNNSAMWEIFEPELRQRLADLESAASYASRTRSVLLEALPSGLVSVQAVALRLAVSPRTLQRRLSDEGTSFRAVVRQTRLRLARHYLGQTRLSLGEIAYLLGFEEPNSFFRAFHSWTGTTPESLRQALRRI